MAPAADGNFSFRGGQHDGILPDRISSDQYRRGVNVTTEGGGLAPRPGFISQEIEVITEGGPEDGCLTYAEIYKRGKFQLATSYDSDEGRYIVTVISGIIFFVDPVTKMAEVIPLGEEGDRLDQYRRRIHWSYAGRFLVLYDYPNQNVILDGRDARRARTEDFEVPASPLGVYLNNRLFIANDGHEFGASDPTGSLASPNAPVTFEESLAPAAAFLGQFFSLGSKSSNQAITAMGFLQVQDTSTGIGPLIIGTRNSVYAFRGDLPRSQWEQVAFGRIMLYNAGIAGPRALANVNSDLMFLSGDNQIRSLALGQTQQQSNWSNTPISREVEPFLKEQANPDLVDLAFVGSYKNRVFFSVAPYQTTSVDLSGCEVPDYAHRGMVVLELDNVSSMTSQAAPAWAGLWTGINPMDVITLEDDVYFYSKDQGGVNRLYKMDPSITYDIFEGEERNIVSRIYTKEYDFGERFFDKQDLSIDYNLTDVSGCMKMVADYKANHFQEWTLWNQLDYKAATQIIEASPPVDKLPNLAPHSFRDLNFGDPDDEECDPITKDLSSVFRKVQVRITIEARNWRLEELRLRADVIDEMKTEPTEVACDNLKNEILVDKKPDVSDWDIYEVAA